MTVSSSICTSNLYTLESSMTPQNTTVMSFLIILAYMEGQGVSVPIVLGQTCEDASGFGRCYSVLCRTSLDSCYTIISLVQKKHAKMFRSPTYAS